MKLCAVKQLKGNRFGFTLLDIDKSLMFGKLIFSTQQCASLVSPEHPNAHKGRVAILSIKTKALIEDGSSYVFEGSFRKIGSKRTLPELYMLLMLTRCPE